MEPIIPAPDELAKSRFTSKVRKQRNIDLVAGLKAANADIQNGLKFIRNGYSISSATGWQLDAFGERFDVERDGMSDEEYRSALRQAAGSLSMSAQSRPSIGSYIWQTYNLEWLRLDRVGLTTGAVGAAFNRVPLRMVFVECGRMAPDIVVPENLVSATFACDIYSAATSPNVELVQGAPFFPGNTFAAHWGGLLYERTQVTIRADDGLGLRIRTGPLKTLHTHMEAAATVGADSLAQPYNTFPTVKKMVVKNNG